MIRHRQAGEPSFTAAYRVWRLVYVEIYDEPRTAISREKQIKGWNRAKKLALIGQLNPTIKELECE